MLRFLCSFLAHLCCFAWIAVWCFSHVFGNLELLAEPIGKPTAGTRRERNHTGSSVHLPTSMSKIQPRKAWRSRGQADAAYTCADGTEVHCRC